MWGVLAAGAAGSGPGSLLNGPVSLMLEPEEPASVYEDLTRKPRFGEADHWSWSVSFGAAFDGDDEHIGPAFDVGVFLADGFQFTFGVAGWAIFQDPDDAVGVNPRIGFRWHFVNEPRHSVYAEAGIGLLFSSEDVPSGGESFNFTPRAGLGATFALGEGDTRLDLGACWHHVSTASTSGSDNNPAWDGVEFYIGIVFGF